MKTSHLVVAMSLILSACPPIGGDSPSGGESATDTGETKPLWQVGTYTDGTPVDNNIPHTTSTTTLVIDLATGDKGKYHYGEGKSLSEGEYAAASGKISFRTGPLASKSISFSENCRLATVDGKTLFRDDVVEDCPTFDKLTASECKRVGTYVKASRSGSSSSSYETAVTIFIDRDRFYSITESSSSTTCYGTTCKTLVDSARPKVGTWKASSTGLTTPDVGGYELEPESCDGSPLPEEDSEPSPSPTPSPTPAPAEMCGNGVCLGSETCSSCPDDCGSCKSKYGACSNDSDCDGVYCVSFDGGNMCSDSCGYDYHCPEVPAGSGLSKLCGGVKFNIYRCFLDCTYGGTCPTGTTCTLTGDGTTKLCQ